MRTLALALALVACGKHDEPAKTKPAAPEVDWARCNQQIATLGTIASPTARVQALIAACPVCGDWKPVLAWATPRAQGGPTRDAILERMQACEAWCNSNAKDFFTAALDDARGTTQRSPWRYLAEQCKDKVSAVPDGRYESATYFALDRIARKVGAPEAETLGKLVFQLPPISSTGAPIDVPDTGASSEAIADDAVLVTVLGDTLYLASPQLAHLTPAGVALVPGARPPYPGKALAADDWKTLHDAIVIAPRAMAAKKLLALLAPAPETVTLQLAVRAKIELSGWPAIERMPLDRKAPVDDKATVQDLAAPH